MKSTDNVGITFANLVLGRGILNGVINITLGAYEFNPDEKGDKVDPAPAIVSRLRLDVPCAIALRDSLTELLAAAEATRTTNGIAEEPAADSAAKH